MSCYGHCDCRREGEDAYRWDRYSHDTQERLRDAEYGYGKGYEERECDRDFRDGFRAEERRAEEREAEQRAEEARESRMAEQRRQQSAEEEYYYEQAMRQYEQYPEQEAAKEGTER